MHYREETRSEAHVITPHTVNPNSYSGCAVTAWMSQITIKVKMNIKMGPWKVPWAKGSFSSCRPSHYKE